MTSADVSRNPLLVHFPAAIDVFLETRADVLSGTAPLYLVLVVELDLRNQQTSESSRLFLARILIGSRLGSGICLRRRLHWAHRRWRLHLHDRGTIVSCRRR